MGRRRRARAQLLVQGLRLGLRPATQLLPQHAAAHRVLLQGGLALPAARQQPHHLPLGLLMPRLGRQQTRSPAQRRLLVAPLVRPLQQQLQRLHMQPF